MQQLPRQAKTVRNYSKKLSSEEFDEIEDLFNRYSDCLNWLLNLFSGIKQMVHIMRWQNIRNDIRTLEKKIKKERKNDPNSLLAKQPLMIEMFGFQGRHWVEAVQEIANILNSMWEGMAYTETKLITANPNLTDDMKAYLYYVLAARPAWQAILLYKEKFYQGTKVYQQLRKKLAAKELQYCQSYLRRITYAHKRHPQVKNKRCMWYDDNMYHFDKNNSALFSFMSEKRGKRYKVELTSPFCYSKSGNIQLILNRQKKRIEIHKLVQAKTHLNNNPTNIEGADKGEYAILSLSSDHEYGIGYSKIVTPEARRVYHRRIHRSKYFKKDKSFIKEIKVLHEEQKKHPLSQRKQKRLYNLQRKHHNLSNRHLGTVYGDKQHNTFVAHSEAIINQAVRQMIKQEKLTKLAKEDLTFVKITKKANNIKTKIMRIYWSFWNKGLINKRLEYLCNSYNVQYQDVNAAYTSKYCPYCNSPVYKRYGKHKEYVWCPICGELNANTIAGKNIKNRLTDSAIKLYTPAKKVAKIMKKRAKQTEMKYKKQYANIL